MAEETVDVAIVGGGIAGLYCCHHLSRSPKFKGKSIKLYEASDRLGGRIETWRIDPKMYGKPAEKRAKMRIKVADLIEENERLCDDKNPGAAPTKLRDMFVAEFGPMRIEPAHQPYLEQLLHELDIAEPGGRQPKWSDLVPFPPYQGEPPAEPQFNLEGEEAIQSTLVDLLLLALRRVFEVVTFTDGDADNDNPWKIGGRPYREANFFWQEFRRETFLHRRFWKRSLRQWINLLEDAHYDFIRDHAYFRTAKLHEVGFWNVLSSVLSHMATVKIRDWASFYHLLPENPSAAAWIVFWLRALKSTDSLRGIRGGMDWIVHSLAKKLEFEIKLHETPEQRHVVYTGNGKVELSLNTRLIKVDESTKGRDGAILLTVVGPSGKPNRVRVEGDVVLALPKGPLQQIEFVGDDPSEEKAEALQILFDAVSIIPLLKCFFIVENPFWEDNRPPSRYAHTTPTRELYYWKSEDKATGMMMVYTDRPGVQYWSDYLTDDHKFDVALALGLGKGAPLKSLKREQRHARIWTWGHPDGRPYPGRSIEKFENERLLRTFLLYAKERGAETLTADRLLAAGMHDWGLKPYEGACHAWRPGIEAGKIIEYLSAFSLCGGKRGERKRLHVCGEAYSDYQGFIEGALRSAARVLAKKPFSLDDTKLRTERKKLPRTVTAPSTQITRRARRGRREQNRTSP